MSEVGDSIKTGYEHYTGLPGKILDWGRNLRRQSGIICTARIGKTSIEYDFRNLVPPARRVSNIRIPDEASGRQAITVMREKEAYD